MYNFTLKILPPLICRIFVVKVVIIKETESYSAFIRDGWDQFRSVPYWILDSLVFDYLLYKTWYFTEHSFMSGQIFFLPCEFHQSGWVRLCCGNKQFIILVYYNNRVYFLVMLHIQLSSHPGTQAYGSANLTHTSTTSGVRERGCALTLSSQKRYMTLHILFAKASCELTSEFNGAGMYKSPTGRETK